MIGLCLAAFSPSLFDASRRRSPLSSLAMVHGVVFSAWLILFFTQSLFIASRRVATHRALGILGGFLSR